MCKILSYAIERTNLLQQKQDLKSAPRFLVLKKMALSKTSTSPLTLSYTTSRLESSSRMQGEEGVSRSASNTERHRDLRRCPKCGENDHLRAAMKRLYVIYVVLRDKEKVICPVLSSEPHILKLIYCNLNSSRAALDLLNLTARDVRRGFGNGGKN